MDSGNSTARSTCFKLTRIGFAHIFPGQTVILADMQCRAAIAPGSCVGGLYQPTFLSAERTGYHLMPPGMLRGDDTRTTPGCTVIRACPHDHSEGFPGTGSFHPIYMDECTLIIQQGRTGHIPVRHLEELVRLAPFGTAFLQAAFQNHHLPTRFFVACKPDSQQIPVITPGYGRAMVMLVERDAGRTFGRFHIDERFTEERCFQRSVPAMFLL